MVEGHQRLVLGERAHRPVRFHHLRQDGRFGGAHHRHAAAAGANVLHRQLEVVEKRGAGADGAAGAAHAADHVGVDEIRRHLAKAQRRLFGGGAFAQQGKLHHAAGAVAVELSHRAAGIAGELIRAQPLGESVPGNANGLHGVRGRIDGKLQAARMAARRIELARREAAGRLAGGGNLGSSLIGKQHVGALGGYLHAAVFALANRPTLRELPRHVAFGESEPERRGSRPQGSAPLPIHAVRIEAFDAPDERVVANVLAHARIVRVAFHVHQRR